MNKLQKELIDKFNAEFGPAASRVSLSYRYYGSSWCPEHYYRLETKFYSLEEAIKYIGEEIPEDEHGLGFVVSKF